MLLVIIALLVSALFYFYVLPLVIYLRDVMFQEDLASSQINQAHPASVNKHGTAVVIGGSIGGLLAATTLSQHFGRVVVLEQNEFDDEKCVAPQGSQVHILLFRGRDILAKMFPGFMEDLKQRGAIFLDPAAEVDTYTAVGGRKPAMQMGDWSDLGSVCSMSRKLLELAIRARVQKIENIELRGDSRVLGLLHADKQVTGVKVVHNATQEDLYADLTVDCSGVGSKSLQWVCDIVDPACTNAAKKYKTHYKLNIVYNSIEFQVKNKEGRLAIREQNDTPLRLVFCLPKFPASKGLVCYEIEDGRAMLLVGGNGKFTGVKTIDEAKEYMATEPEFTRECLDIIADQMEDPEQRFVTYKKDGSVFNHFHELKVKGFIALGDCVASFNPVYGQGMTTAAEACLTLDRFLRASTVPIQQNETICEQIQHQIYMGASFPWFTASVIDLTYPETEGGSKFYRQKIVPKLLEKALKNMQLGVKDGYIRKNNCMAQHMVQGYKWLMFDPKAILKGITIKV